MKISDLMDEKLVFLDVPGNSRREVITRIVEKIAAATRELKHPEKFVNEVLDRERLGSTGIGDEVAIPHARTTLVDRILVAFARTEKPVDFEALDGKPVRYIFLMAVPIKELRSYLATLATISRLVKNKSLRKVFQTAQTSAELLNAIRDAEQEISG